MATVQAGHGQADEMGRVISEMKVWTEDAKSWRFVLSQRDPGGHETALYHSRSKFRDLEAAVESALALAKACDRHGPSTVPVNPPL